MRVFTCRPAFEDVASCIYDAWAWGNSNGHGNLRLEREPVFQERLFDEYVHVEADLEKVQKFIRSVKGKISRQAYDTIFLSSLYREDVLDDIYGFLHLGFRVGGEVEAMLTDPYVMKLKQVRKNVVSEYHAFKEFLRFDEVGADTFVAHIEPKNDILPLLGPHFVQRMPSLSWIIVDDRRRKALIRPREEAFFLQELSKEEFARLSRSEEGDVFFHSLWKSFFHAISIKERENYRLQRRCFPLWMRKHATEFRR